MATINNPLGAGIGNTNIPEAFPAEGSVSVKVGAVAITRGMVCVWNTINTAILPTAIPGDAGVSDPALIAGVALNDAAVGGVVLLQRNGPCLVNIDDDTVSAGQQATLNATVDGAAAGVTADATSIVGDYFGVFLGAEVGSTNQAYVDVRL